MINIQPSAGSEYRGSVVWLPLITRRKMKNLPEGKGLYVWNVIDMPGNWDLKFQAMGITWIAVKIADGVNSSNLRRLDCGGKVDDILGLFIYDAKCAGMMVLGWQYVYGFNPEDEAKKAAQRVEKFNLDGFIIDAEHQYKGKRNQAQRYSAILRRLLPDTPIGLSTYRFPEIHPTLPYREFLDICDFNAPQMYWNKGKAGQELAESYEQYLEIKELPFIPAGRAYYGEGFPRPTSEEVVHFLDMAQSIGCPAAFFWSADALYHRTRPLPEIREAIGGYKWSPPVKPPIVVDAKTLILKDVEIQIEDRVYANTDPIKLKQI